MPTCTKTRSANLHPSNVEGRLDVVGSQGRKSLSMTQDMGLRKYMGSPQTLLTFAMTNAIKQSITGYPAGRNSRGKVDCDHRQECVRT